MLGPKNITRHELIGLDMRVVSADDPSVVGRQGKVVDETRQTILVSTESGVKTLPKQGLVFEVFSGEQVFELQGNNIMFRPEDRPKKVK